MHCTTSRRICLLFQPCLLIHFSACFNAAHIVRRFLLINSAEIMQTIFLVHFLHLFFKIFDKLIIDERTNSLFTSYSHDDSNTRLHFSLNVVVRYRLHCRYKECGTRPKAASRRRQVVYWPRLVIARVRCSSAPPVHLSTGWHCVVAQKRHVRF